MEALVLPSGCAQSNLRNPHGCPDCEADPSVVNAAIVHSDVSSEESGCHLQMDTATCPNPMSISVPQEKRRKSDPLHQYRVAGSVDVPAKKRNTTAGSLKEVLYPKSMQPIPDRSCGWSAVENEVRLSAAKNMQSPRSPRGAVKESRPQDDTWTARDITNNKSQQPQADMRAAKDVTNSRCQQSQGSAKDLHNSTANQSQADTCAAKDFTNCKSHKSLVDVSAAKDTTNRRAQRAQAEMWAAREITNRKSQRAQTDNSGARSFTNSKSGLRAAPRPESKMLLPRNEEPEPKTLRGAQSSKSPPRQSMEKPKLIASSSKSLKPSTVKQGTRAPQHVRSETGVAATSSTITTTADPSTSKTKPLHPPLPEDTMLLSSTTKEPSAAVNVCSVTETSLSSATDIKRCNSSLSALPRAFSSRPKDLGDMDDIVSHISAASTEVETCNASREDEFINPALDRLTFVRSSIPESVTRCAVSSPQLETPVEGTHQQPCPSNPLTGRVRHKFVMEATEIKSRNSFWRRKQGKSSKAVLFSNPAFTPASPHGARPASENGQRPVAVASTHKSPVTSASATRRVMDRIGRAISSLNSPNLTSSKQCKEFDHNDHQLCACYKYPARVKRVLAFVALL